MVRFKKLEGDLRKYKVLGLDTSVFIYHFEGGKYSALTTKLFGRVVEGSSTAVASTINLAEVLVLPIRTGNLELADYYRSVFIGMPNLTMVDVTEQVSVRAAEIRARYNTKMSEGILLATCIEHGGKAFVTNESALKRVNEVDIVVLDEYLSQ